MNRRTTTLIFIVATCVFPVFQAVGSSAQQSCKQPASDAKQAADSPFGLFNVFAPHARFSKDMKFSNADYWKWAGDHFRNLGAKWSRHNLLFIWGIVEPEIGRGYRWKNKQIMYDADGILSIAYQYGGDNFNMVAVVDPSRSKTRISIKGHEEDFRRFVRAAVERYGAHGTNKADPNVRVKFWQAANELALDWFRKKGTVDEYVDFLRMFSKEVKSADPEAKVIMGAEIADRNQRLSPHIKAIISKLSGERVFDVVDIHYWELAGQYKMDIAREMRKYLDDHGYQNVEIWSMEQGTYVNRPNPSKYEPDPPFQTEKEQAVSLVKRFIYNLAHDVNKIFWNNLVEWNCFAGECGNVFDNMGLISDGRNSGETLASLNVPRLSYHTYKKMTETLECSDWNNIRIIQEKDGVHIYKFRKNGKAVWAAWNDRGTAHDVRIVLEKNTKSVRIADAVPKYESGKEVADYGTAFKEIIRKDLLESDPPQLYLELGTVPVYVEEI